MLKMLLGNQLGKLKVKSNSSNPITELDSDRVEVIEYFITSLSSLEPSGVSQVNLNYQNYLKTKVSENDENSYGTKINASVISLVATFPAIIILSGKVSR